MKFFQTLDAVASPVLEGVHQYPWLVVAAVALVLVAAVLIYRARKKKLPPLRLENSRFRRRCLFGGGSKTTSFQAEGKEEKP